MASEDARTLRPNNPGGPIGVGPRALAAVGLVVFFVWQSFYPHAADFKTFYSAGFAIRHPEIPLYDLVALDENPFGEVFKLPPSAALYVAPLTVLELQQARFLWRLGLVAALFAAYALLLHTVRVEALSWPWLAGLGAWALFGPAQVAVGEGQWDPLLLLLLAVAAWGMQSSRPVVAGLALAVAASIKPYPLIVAGVLVARRWWRGLLAALVGTVALVGTGSLVAGTEETWTFLTRVLPASGATTPYVDNQALGGVLARLAVNDFKPVPLAGAPSVDLAVRAISAVVLALTIWLVGRRRAESGDERAMQLALFVPLSILLLPAAWTHYATILLLPLTLVVAHRVRHAPRAWVVWVALGVAYVLLAIPNPTMLYGPEVDRALWLRGRADAANLALQREYATALARLVFSYKAFATLLLFGLVAHCVAALRAMTTPSERAPEPRPRATTFGLARAPSTATRTPSEAPRTPTGVIS